MTFRAWLLLLAAVLLTASAIAAEPDPAATRDFNATAALQNSGFYERARDRWKEFLARYPQDERLDRANYYLGIAQLKSDQFAEAKTTFEQLLAKYPNFAQRDKAQFNLGFALYFLAEQSKQPADYQKAAAALELVPKNYGQSDVRDRAVFYQASAQYLAGDAKAARAAYERFANDFRDSPLLPDALFALGALCQQQGDLAKSAETYRAFLANAAFLQHERATEVRMRLGGVLFALQDYTAARELFAELAQRADFAAADRATLDWARCLIELNQLDEARQRLQAALDKYKESDQRPALQYYLGLTLFRQNKLDEARPPLEVAASASDALSPLAAQLLAKTLLKQQKPTEALAGIEQALAKHTNDPQTPALELERCGILRELPERRKELPALYKAFLDKYPEHPLRPLAQAGYATESLEQGDWATARKQAEDFLSQPDWQGHAAFPAMLFVTAEANYLALDQEPHGDAAKAEASFRQVAEKFPDFVYAGRAHVRIGQLWLRAERYDDARNYISGVLGKLKHAADKADAQLVIGRTQSAQARPVEAQRAYEAALAADANWLHADEALLRLADALRRQEKLPEADQRLDQLLARFANSPYRAQALVQRGDIALALQKHDDAVARYREVLDKHAQDPLKPAAQYGLAAALYAKRDDPTAAQTLNTLLKDEPSDSTWRPRGHYLRGLVLERQQQFAPAAQDFATFLKTSPPVSEGAPARLALARCQLGQQQFQAAVDSLTALARDMPDYPALDQAYYELGHAQLGLNDAAAAADAFATIGTRYPQSPLAAEAQFHVGRRHEELAAAAAETKAQQAELALALAAYQQGAAHAAAGELREKLQFKLGEVQYRLAQYAAAAGELEAFLRDYPQSPLLPTARFLVAECRFQQQQYDQALPLFVQTANEKVEPHHALALFRAGTCEAHRQHWAESQQQFTALLNTFPQFAEKSEARYALGIAHFEQKQIDQARGAWQAVIDETDAEPAAKAHYMLGEIAFGEKKYPEAIEHYVLVAEGYPYPHWQGLARFEIARAFLELGDKAQAVKTLEAFLAKHAEHEQRASAEQLLRELKK
jgi:TolA-binding protein